MISFDLRKKKEEKSILPYEKIRLGSYGKICSYIDEYTKTTKLSCNYIFYLGVIQKYYNLPIFRFINHDGLFFDCIALEAWFYGINNYSSNSPYKYRTMFNQKEKQLTDSDDFNKLSKHIDGFFESDCFRTYKLDIVNSIIGYYKLNKSKFLQPTTTNNRNKYIHINNKEWYDTGYNEYSFDDSEFKRIELDKEYIIIREWSGFYKYKLEIGICKYLDKEDKIALIEKRDKLMIPREVEDFDPYTDLKSHRRSKIIDNILP
jgi:hypothetical protein